MSSLLAFSNLLGNLEVVLISRVLRPGGGL